MSAQDIILGSRVAHLRELKTELEKLKAEDARLHDENQSLKNHFDLALIAAEDLRGLSPEGKLVIIDGWNQILGAQKVARNPAELIAQARQHLGDRPQDLVWIVFDGPKENVRDEGRLRISYTGGTGPHRADRFIVDFFRMAKYLGLSDKIEVRTDDKDFVKEINRLR